MKKQIRETLNRLFALVALATVLTGAVLASPLTSRERMTETADQKSAKNVAVAHWLPYQTGRDFAWALSDAANLDKNQNAISYTIVDLVYLIDSLEGQPEVAQLQGTLKGIVRGTKKSAQVVQEIQAAMNSYQSRQNVEQKWYFNAGLSTVNLTIASYANDGAGIKKGLSDLQSLIKTAPQGTPQTIVEAMKGLTKHAAKTNFTKEDCTAIINDVKIVTNAVYA